MIKHLVKHGNSWALVIDKPILDLLKIDPEMPVELKTDGQSVTITPTVETARKKTIREASKKINERYSKVFKKLAE
jgi:antitoxin MazE